MLTQAEAIIYLSNLRGCSQQEWCRSYHTFNFGEYQQRSRNSIEKLQVLNDDTLKAGSTLTHTMLDDTGVFLLPLIGGLNYRSNNGVEGSLDVGEAHVLLLPSNSTLEVTNPYENELINYLQLWFRVDKKNDKLGKAGKFEFDLIAQRNKLISLRTIEGPEVPGTRILIGNYEGRNDGTYQLNDPAKGIFVFIVEGAFEVQNRLLQSRDGLWLSNTSEIEFEALSGEGIILVIEPR